MTQPLISADISIFQRKLANIALSRNADKDYKKPLPIESSVLINFDDIFSLT